MFPVTKKSETPTTITLQWTPVPGADGYRFYSAGVLRSKTMDPARSTVKFSKGQEPYVVEAVVLNKLDSGTYPSSAPVYKKVAPRVAYKAGNSDARFCCENQPGVVRQGGGWVDESGSTYDENGLCSSGTRSDGPAVTSALEIDGRPYCSLPTMGDPTKNTGSWLI